MAMGLVTPDPLEAEDRPGRKSRPRGQPYLHALENRFHPGVPPTDDFGEGVALCNRRSTAVPGTALRSSSITHPEGLPGPRDVPGAPGRCPACVASASRHSRT